MTHKDIYTKFMIEYDKANVTSSYPSLTEYEVATVLDKAYNALIALKVTGNNVRRAGFENDVKSIADLSPLVTNGYITNYASELNINEYHIPEDMLYFVQASLVDGGGSNGNYERFANEYNPMDGMSNRNLPVKLVSHDMAQKFIVSSHNMPWIKTPVCYIENDKIFVVYDPLTVLGTNVLNITYIHKPNTFVKDLDKFYKPIGSTVTYFDYTGVPDNCPVSYVYQVFPDYTGGDAGMTQEQFDALNLSESCVKIVYAKNDTHINELDRSYSYKSIAEQLNQITDSIVTSSDFEKLDPEAGNAIAIVYENDANLTYKVDYIIAAYPDLSVDYDNIGTYGLKYTFECNDTVAEELISLAIAFALENVESSRLNSKLNMRGLEA